MLVQWPQKVYAEAHLACMRKHAVITVASGNFRLSSKGRYLCGKPSFNEVLKAVSV
jgi:hypothetical protein